MPLVSLIIPTHHRPHLLPYAIASAKSSARDVEVIVVDDASSDDTYQVCNTFKDIKYVRIERNQGVAGARNVGIIASSSEYIGFLDDDDTRLFGSLDRQLEILNRAPEAMLIYGQAFVEDNGRMQGAYPHEALEGDIFWQLLIRNFIPCGSAVFRRAVISSVGLLDDQVAGIDDWDLWIRISEMYPVIAMPSPVTVWRRSSPVSNQGSSRSARLVLQSVRQFHHVWRGLPRFKNAPDPVKQMAWRGFSLNMAEHLLGESARSVRHRDFWQPVMNLAVLMHLHPLTLLRIAQKRTSNNDD